MQMYTYEVGQKIFPASNSNGSRFGISDSGGSLLVEMTKPSAAEKREFKRGIQFKVTVVNGIIFVLYRMGTMPWSDCPYSKWLSNGITELTPPADGQGLAVHCMLVDSSSGVLVAQKVVGMETETTRKLFAAIDAQPEICNYDEVLARTFAAYRTTDLLKMADQQ